VSPVKYELGFYSPEDILHGHCRETLKSYRIVLCFLNMILSHLARLRNGPPRTSREVFHTGSDQNLFHESQRDKLI
jgi:hypothetical protein